MPEKRAIAFTPDEAPHPTGFTARLQQFVSWSHEDKGLFLSGFAIAGLLTIFIALTVAGYAPGIDAYVDSNVLQQGLRAVQLFLIGSVLLAGFFFLFIWRHARAADRIGWFIRFALAAFVGELFYVVYLIGFLSAGFLALAVTVCITRFAFDRRLGLFVLALVSGGLVLLTFAQWAGLIAYAPAFIVETGAIYRHPVILWSGCVGLLMVLGVLYGMLDFIANRMHELSTTDGLTKISNRRHFMDVFTAEFQRATRYKRSFSLLILDLDHFKQVNDRYGHLVGDDVLRVIARVLTGELRRYDTVGRYGGEEFAILLPETDLDGAERFAQRCLTKIESAPLILGETRLAVTVSIGVASYPASDVRGVDELTALADTALYRAKNEGRNRIIVAPAGPVNA